MSDTPVPPEQTTGPDHDVEVDLAAFLPEGVELGEPGDEAEDVIDSADEPEEPAAEEAVDVADEPEATAAEAPTTEGAGAPDPAVLDAIQADLDAVDAALLTLDAGTYGTCATCGAPIPDEALAADPTRTACAAH